MNFKYINYLKLTGGMTRLLTEKEIANILDCIKPNTSLPIECGLSIVENHKNRLTEQLKKCKVYPSVIPELKKQIKNNYIKSLIDSGESVGILAAQSIGEKQTQSSVSYDEEILIKVGDTISRTTIGKFIDEYIDNKGCIVLENGSEVQECNDVRILTISKDEKIEWKEINEVSRHPPHGNLVKVTTESGRNVITTMSHSHLKKEFREVVPVLGEDLRLGDKIPVIKKSKFSGCKTNFIDLSEYIKTDPFEYDSDGNIPLGTPTNFNANKYVYSCNERTKRYVEIEDIMWFLSIFLEKGKISNDEVVINCKNNQSDVYEILESFCNKYEFNCVQTERYFFQFFTNKFSTHFIIISKIFASFVHSLFKNESIPEFVFGLDEKQLRTFLKTYFKEGGFDNIGKINEDLSFLLTYFGIYSRIKGDRLVIQQKYKNLFLNEFSIEINEKNIEDDFQVLEDNELNEDATRLIYNFKNEYIHETASDINIEPEMKLEKINTDIDLESFIADYIVNATEHNSFHRRNYFNIQKNLKYLLQVSNSGVVWEKIVKLELIEEKEYEYTHVYDFSVTGNETFALFSGIVVHNTLNTLIGVSYTKSIASLIL